MTNFNHPGGRDILESAKWIDVSRYLWGVTFFEEIQEDAYKHSADAFRELKDRQIGTLTPVLP